MLALAELRLSDNVFYAESTALNKEMQSEYGYSCCASRLHIQLRPVESHCLRCPSVDGQHAVNIV